MFTQVPQTHKPIRQSRKRSRSVEARATNPEIVLPAGKRRRKAAPSRSVTIPEIQPRRQHVEPFRLRSMPVQGNNMAPTIAAGNHVMVAPACEFSHPGLYVVALHGAPEIYRVGPAGDGVLRLSMDCGRYRDVLLSEAEFERVVLGQVAGVLTIIEPHLVREALQFH